MAVTNGEEGAHVRGQKQKPSIERNWFITDRAIESAKDDTFGHDDVASQLVAIATSIRPPGTIGLIGGFGTGKSSIGNLLAERLRAHADFQVVCLSAEKHSDTARQRALVYSFAEALREDAGVDPSKIEDKLAPAEKSSSVAGPELETLPLIDWARKHGTEVWRAIGIGLVFLLAFGIASFAIGLLQRYAWNKVEINPVTFPITSGRLAVPLVIALFAGLVSLVSAWGTAAMKPRTITLSRPRAEAADELERVFSELAGLIDKQLIIIVDDIDRLAPRDVLEALGSIKTFQSVPKDHPPLFIITCDDKVVRQALEDAREDSSPAVDTNDARVSAEEYLNKLFVVRQPLPPLIPGDMVPFARELLAAPQTNHAGPEALGKRMDDVLDILIHDGVNNPRHVIRLLNAFFADYRLAQQREKPNQRLAKDEVTGQPLTLARLTVLRVDFPERYDQVNADFDLLEAMDKLVLREEIDEPGLELLRGAGLVTGVDDMSSIPAPLADFLRRTVHYIDRAQPLEPFFYMGQTSDGRTLGSSRATYIRRALENHDEAALTDMLTGDAGVASAATRYIVSSLKDVRQGLPRRNAVATASAAIASAPAADRPALADALAQLILRDPTAVAPASGLADILRSAEYSYNPALTDMLTDFEEPPDARRVRAEAILGLAVEQSDDARLRRALDGYFGAIATTDGWSEVQPWVARAAAIEPGHRNKILADSFFTAVVDASVGSADGAVGQDTADSFGRLLDEALPAVRSSTALAEAIRNALTAEGAEARWFATEMLEHLVPPETATSGLLLAVSATIADPERMASSETTTRALSFMNRALEQFGADPASADPDAVNAVVEALDFVLREGDEASITAAGPPLGTAGALWPDPIYPAVDAAMLALEPRRDPDNATGAALQHALLALMPSASDQSVDRLSELLDPLDAGGSLEDANVKMALEALATGASSVRGSALILRHVPAWRSQFGPSVVDADEVRVQTEALRLAASRGCLDDAEEEKVFNRIVGASQHSTAAGQAAFTAFAMIPWTGERQLAATQQLDALWDSVPAPAQLEAVRYVSSGEDLPGRLDPAFTGRATSLALEGEPSAGAALLKLWDALTPADRSRAVGEGFGSIPGIETRVAALDSTELADALRPITDPERFREILGATAAGQDVVRSETASILVHELLAGDGWTPARAEALGPHLDDDRARRCVEDAIPRLQTGATDAHRAATVLGVLWETHPEALAGFEQAIADAVTDLLPESTVELADRLGLASRAVPGNAFSDLVKDMRGRKNDHGARAAADAFLAGRQRRPA